MSNKVMVTIDSRQYIPFINRIGPILVPISIDEQVAANLKTLGYRVNIIENANISIDGNGNRYITTAQNFEAVDETSTLSVTGETQPEPVLEVVDTAPKLETTEHVVEEPVVETVTTEETPAAVEDEDAITLLSYEEYAAMDLKPLRNFLLNEVADYIDPKVLATVPKARKDDLLAIIKDLLESI